MTVVEQAAVSTELPDQPAPAPPPVPLRRNRDFVLLWAGAGMAFLGTRVSALAYTLVTFWSTGSATAAGLVTFAALLPNLLVQLPAGAFVDQWDRRRTMIVCDLGRIVAIGSVAVAVLSGHVWVAHLMVVAFVEASLGVFYRLSERAAVRNVVAPDQLGAAMAGNEARGQAAGLLGQPIGSLLFSLVAWIPFGFTALAHLGSLTTLLFIRKSLQAEQEEHRAPRILARIREGFAFVWGQKYLRRALGLLAASNILFQVLALALIVIVKEDGGTPPVIGFILAVNGVGGMLGALSSNFFMKRFGIRKIIMFVNVSWAGLMAAIAFAHHPVALAAIYTAIVYGAGVGNVAGMVYQVKTTPDNMQGRVGSISMLLASGANSIGALIAGFALDAFTSTTAVLAVTAVMALLAILSVLAFGGRRAAEAEAAINLTR
ncbi:MFS transporter [Catellatospora sp. TT07R-123]|uniref:MFS transporter n=1 Tax=Catellatospora sp. TT07R-123 TaxID=2733863 RepID=UPI001B1BD83E|nr:MFS transporter [Catellatospora sp. TT07R-123]GHJ48848.1 MFS transporter [Catellatospora sp. TT07R-123]